MSNDTNNIRHDHKTRWGRVFLVFVAIVLLLLIGAYFIWTTGAKRTLEKQVAEYKAAGEPIEPEDFVVTGVAEDDNAVVNIRAAMRSIDSNSENRKAYDMLNVAVPLTDREISVIRAFVAENAVAFDEVDTAMTKKGVDWGLSMKPPVINFLLPDLNHQRTLAQLLAARAMLRHHDGNHAGALGDIQRAQFLSGAVGRQPVLVAHLVSVGIEALAMKKLEQMAPDLRIGTAKGEVPPAQIEAMIRSLLDDSHLKESEKLALLGERMIQLDTVRSIANGTLSITSIRGGTTPGNAATAALGWVTKPFVLGDGAILIVQTTAVRNAAQAAADLPEYNKTAPALPPQATGKKVNHMWLQILMPSFDRAIATRFRIVTERHMVAAALAVRWYATDHAGALPKTLDELVPKYLPSLPLDLMSAGWSVRFIPNPANPILYSVGENGVDDGGSEASKNNRKDVDRWQRADAVLHLTRRPRPEPEPVDDGVGGLSTQPAATEPAMTEPAP